MTAQRMGKCIIDVMTRHAYLPTTIISDRGSQFTAELVQEITKILDIEIRHATTKHAQRIGILERTHASIKTALKISTGQRKSMWHKHVQIAVMNHNTTYHESIGCEPSTVFHGRIPYNALDLKLGIKPQWQQQRNTELADQLQKQLTKCSDQPASIIVNTTFTKRSNLPSLQAVLTRSPAILEAVSNHDSGPVTVRSSTGMFLPKNIVRKRT